jgi:adenosylhomocysteinase
MNALTWPDGCGPDQIVDDGGDATILLIEGLAAEKEFKATGKLPNWEAETSEDC